MLIRLKRFIKELKRVKWPTPSSFFNYLLLTLLFCLLTSLFFYYITIGFTDLWKILGVGL